MYFNLNLQVESKPKVEDGIFGTSGGFGFTKQNELFVGRVAMIGFAVSTQLLFSKFYTENNICLFAHQNCTYIS